VYVTQQYHVGGALSDCRTRGPVKYEWTAPSPTSLQCSTRFALGTTRDGVYGLHCDSIDSSETRNHRFKVQASGNYNGHHFWRRYLYPSHAGDPHPNLAARHTMHRTLLSRHAEMNIQMEWQHCLTREVGAAGVTNT
jgi:hypothetical protein